MDNRKPLMKCGHTAQAVDGKGNHICAICMCDEIETDIFDLTGRKARCIYFGQAFMFGGRRVTCHGETDSRYELPFFKNKPDSEHDEYYCGCWGWD